MRAGVIAEGGGNFFDPFFGHDFAHLKIFQRIIKIFFAQSFAYIKTMRNFAPVIDQKNDRFSV